MDAGVLILFVAIVVAVIIAIRLFSGKSVDTSPPPAGVANELQRVKVRYVIDGDTVIVSKAWREIRIRLDAIDCPEDGQSCFSMAMAQKFVTNKCNN